jgi:hypothetical protein
MQKIIGLTLPALAEQMTMLLYRRHDEIAF